MDVFPVIFLQCIDQRDQQKQKSQHQQAKGFATACARLAHVDQVIHQISHGTVVFQRGELAGLDQRGHFHGFLVAIGLHLHGLHFLLALQLP